MKFRKRPVEIEAVQVNRNGPFFSDMPGWLVMALENGTVSHQSIGNNELGWVIKTLEDGPNGEAKHVASPNDWIIQGVKGELYFCKPDIFETTYEPVETTERR